jgi:Holliday junction resolvase RusA-like endonuclease
MTRPTIRLTCYGTPQPKGSSRSFIVKGKGNAADRAVTTSANPNLKGWEANIRSELQCVMAHTDRALLDDIFRAPVAVTLVFHLYRPKSAKRDAEPTRRPDLDKLARAAIDALNGVLFKDDSQVIAIGARKRYATSATRLDILVESWAPIHTLAVGAALSPKRTYEQHRNDQRTAN